MDEKKQNERDNIIFKTTPKYSKCGIAFFQGLSLDDLGLLLHKELIDPQEHADNGPSTSQFYKFMIEWEKNIDIKIELHGIVTNNIKPHDCGVVIEAIELKTKSEFCKDLLIDFCYLTRKGKKLILKKNYAYCSWAP